MAAVFWKLRLAWGVKAGEQLDCLLQRFVCLVCQNGTRQMLCCFQKSSWLVLTCRGSLVSRHGAMGRCARVRLSRGRGLVLDMGGWRQTKPLPSQLRLCQEYLKHRGWGGGGFLPLARACLGWGGGEVSALPLRVLGGVVGGVFSPCPDVFWVGRGGFSPLCPRRVLGRAGGISLALCASVTAGETEECSVLDSRRKNWPSSAAQR